MNSFSNAIALIEKINRDLEKVDQLYKSTNVKRASEKSNIESNYAKLKNEFSSSLNNFENDNINRFINSVEDVITSVLSIHNLQMIRATENYNTLSYKEAVSKLGEIVTYANELADKLNAVDFMKLVPPITYKIDNEEVVEVVNGEEVKRYSTASNPPTVRKIAPTQELAEQFCSTAANALACANRVKEAYREELDVNAYNAFLTREKEAFIEETINKIELETTQEINDIFVSESAKKEYSDAFDAFDSIIKEGEASEVNMHEGSLNYSEKITIGSAKLSLGENCHTEYIEKFDILKNNLSDKSLVTPVIWDLKKDSNIMLKVSNKGDYSQQVIAFVKQIALQFAMAFPAGGAKIKLIDINDRIGFSEFKKLESANKDILLGGIVRDDRELEDTIKDIEKLMYKIDEDKISYNACEDIFEYNRNFETAPQCTHLLVLVDFPAGLNGKLAASLEKIIKNGSKCGIFTVLIYNDAIAEDYNFKQNDVDKFISTMERNSLVITEFNDKSNSDGKLILPISVEHSFSPKKSIGTNLIPKIVDVLKHNAKEKRQVNITIDSMFEACDAARAISKYESAAAVLDIPIGMNGGEVQNLLLKTTGNGSAHAVVIGGTGSGKSNLLHTLILNTCYKYSPDEVNLYIIDFKGGVEFKFYEANKVVADQIPHIKLTGLTSNVEDGVSIIKNLQTVMAEREDIFRRANAEDIVRYCEMGHIMPRLFVIIDEIQELFERDAKLSEIAVDVLGQILKKGRALGINVLWASQNIPNAVGIRDKIVSQIGNRICLRLDDPENARNLNIDPRAVKELNRPEKGLALINDIRYGNSSVELRVAFAESSEKRRKYSSQIIDKWKNTGYKNTDALYIVGDDEKPSPTSGNTIFAVNNPAENIVSKAFEAYNVQIGHNFITGKPYNIALPILEQRANISVYGHEINILMDIMGYSLLSCVIEHKTNADCKNEPTKIYYANGEMVNPKTADDLFNVIPNDFSDIIENVSAPVSIKSALKDLYDIYKQRVAESESTNQAKVYSPCFMFVNSLQRYIDLLNETSSLKESDNSTSESSPDLTKMLVSSSTLSQNSFAIGSFAEVFTELLSRGGTYGIHFVISLDRPKDLPSGVAKELFNSSNKVFTKGAEVGSYDVNNLYRLVSTIKDDKIAVVSTDNEAEKVRLYSYESKENSPWYSELKQKYQNLRG